MMLKKLCSYVLTTAVLASSVLLSGCDNPYRFINTWSRAVQLYGMNPVYPPRNDFQVGDVYLSLSDPKLALSTKNPWRVFHYNSLLDSDDHSRIMNYFNSRLSVVESPSENVVSYSNTVKLNDAALPTITIKNINNATLWSIFPVNIMKAGLGLGWTTRKDLNISFENAYSSRINAKNLNGILNIRIKDEHDLARLTGFTGGCDELVESLEARGALKKNGSLTFYMNIPYEVYYAKKIVATIVNSNANVMLSGASIPIPVHTYSEETSKDGDVRTSKITEKTERKNINTDGTTFSVIEYKETDTQANPEVLANALRSELGSALNQNLYGGSVQYSRAKSEGLSYNQTLTTPVAIAYKGIAYKITLFEFATSLKERSGEQYSKEMTVLETDHAKCADQACQDGYQHRLDELNRYYNSKWGIVKTASLPIIAPDLTPANLVIPGRNIPNMPEELMTQPIP